MNNHDILDIEGNTLWQKMYLKVKIQRIIYWILCSISLIGIVLMLLSIISIPRYFYFIGVGIGLGFSIISVILSLLSFMFYKNLIIIESIKIARKIDQLIFISQKNSFQDRRGLGRKILAIAALADLAPKEAIEPLSFMVQDPNCKHKRLITQALTEIDCKLAFYTEKGIPSNAHLEPYKDRDGNYISLFNLERKTIIFVLINYITSLIFFAIIFLMIISEMKLIFGVIILTEPTTLIVFIGLFVIIFEIIVIIAIILSRVSKIKLFIEQKNVYDLITLINKSNFGFLRIIKGVGISALGDIGSPEAISSLITMTQTPKTDIQNKAVLALDIISVKNGIDKRYVLQIH
ncbi:MAG: hypothetical protein JXA54_00205 [Candidatus Heimdallarchaeota archaeon]|nr:hypothetical protein [Candidatus Heimdallarchaeota archaeon]